MGAAPKKEWNWDDVPSQYLQCRMIAHQWQTISEEEASYKPQVFDARYGEVIVLRCLHCGTERRDCFNVWGRLGARHYVHPEGYKMDPLTTPQKAEMRQQYLRQQKLKRRKLKAV